jgi:16S rRNA (guanine(966)-N(2))-methyltransferase RsmD
VTRIVAGSLGGRRITAPPGRDTRPTSDRVREALFSTLEAMTNLHGARFADLYAGSGAVGLEAASRGAARVLLVETAPSAARVARANVSALGLGEVVEVAARRVEAVLATAPDRAYDVVFADPPYPTSDTEVAQMLAALTDRGWLAPDAVVVVERSVRSPEPDWPAGLSVQRGRRYGETMLWYGRASASRRTEQ